MIVAKEEFDIVVMDNEMEGMMGYEAVASMRQMELLHGSGSSYIVAWTSDGDAWPKDSFSNFYKGANDRLPKSIGKIDLVVMLNKCPMRLEDFNLGRHDVGNSHKA